MASYDNTFMQIVKVFKKDQPLGNFDLLDYGVNDLDITGENGLEFITQDAKDNGFENDLDYWESITPHQTPQNLKQMESNWNFLMDKMEQSSNYYARIEPIFEAIELDNSIVVVASASILTYT